MMNDARALHESVVTLRGRESATQDVVLPLRSDVLIFAQETSLDVVLEVRTAGKLVGQADSPIRRAAVQRVSLNTGSVASYSITLSGKEHPGARGDVSLRVVALPRSAAAAQCFSVQRTVAAAEVAYASGSRPESTQGGASNAATAYNAAANAYSNAVGRLQALGASQLLAQVRHAQASLFYEDVRDWAQANEHASKASAAYAAIGDAYGQSRADSLGAEARIEIASALRPAASGVDAARASHEAFEEVRQTLTRIASFHSARGERYEQALALNNIGVSYHLESLYDDAIRAYRSALPVYSQLGERPREAQVLQNMALVEYELGRLSEAIRHYAQILSLSQEEDDARLYVTILSNSALANWASGNADAALRQFGEALSILRRVPDTYLQGVALHNIGCVYDTLGDQERALDFYRQALALRTPELDARGRMATLNTIGNVLREQGNVTEALKMHEEALSLAVAKPARARIDVQIAKDLAALGRFAEASQRLERVLGESDVGGEVVRARALVERGQQRAARGEVVPAEADLRLAVKTFQNFEAPVDEFEAWVALARTLRGRGASDSAMEAIDKALALAEEVRVQSANPELRATLLQPLRPAFDLKIAMLAERYFSASANAARREQLALSALQTAEQARARALADFQHLDLGAPGVAPELVTQRRDIYRELAARRFRLAAIVDRAGTEDPRVGVIREDIATLRRQLDEIDARIGAASSGTASARSAPKRNASTMAASPVALDVRALPADVAVVEYWLGGEGAYAWTATREGLLMARLGASAVLSDAARQFHTALRGFGTTPAAERLRLGAQLYDLVVRPLGPLVPAQRKLVFAPDGALHYVPFATLRQNGPGGTKFLIERHDVAVTPSLSLFLGTGSKSRGEPPSREMLLVADPVYELSDARLAVLSGATSAKSEPASSIWPLSLFRSGDDGEMPRLPGSAREAAAIAKLMPAGSVDLLEGFEATRERFLEAELGRYRFIHIASHAVNDAEIPQASALVLSTVDRQSSPIDGRVLAADFVGLQLNADTVVLSACDTAMGKNVAGEGLIGLNYVMLARGAGSVVSSLWPVADYPAGQLMARFYEERLNEGAPVAAALSRAMRSMLTGRFSDPAVWGTFTLTVSRMGGV